MWQTLTSECSWKTKPKKTELGIYFPMSSWFDKFFSSRISCPKWLLLLITISKYRLPSKAPVGWGWRKNCCFKEVSESTEAPDHYPLMSRQLFFVWDIPLFKKAQYLTRYSQDVKDCQRYHLLMIDTLKHDKHRKKIRYLKILEIPCSPKTKRRSTHEIVIASGFSFLSSFMTTINQRV
jgi:hypothetical protein